MMSEPVELFRAVELAEAADIAETGDFALGPSQFPKQFGLSLRDTLKFANSNIGNQTVAIVKTAIPTSIFIAMEHVNPDGFMFKDGVLTVYNELLGVFNAVKDGISHAF